MLMWGQPPPAVRFERSSTGLFIEAGCEYAVVVTRGGTTSQRNCECLGFRVAYSKVTVVKNFKDN
jgi:hypothetical protein